jgi:hypothetical protein
MDTQHEVELNFFYLHWRDAQKLVEWADENRESKLRSLYARHAILSCVFAVEAMTNKLVSDFYLNPTGLKSFQKLPLRDRLFALPLVCGIGQPVGRTLDQSKEPFQSFSELVDIRNWLVHPKGGTFIGARTVYGSIRLANTAEDVPIIETEFGSHWPHTKIPVNPFELTELHAHQVLDITRSLISEIKSLFDGILTEEWFDEITFRSRDGKYEMKTTIQSLWVGYTPEKSKTVFR